MKCSNCKRNVPGTFPYCDYCGTAIVERVKGKSVLSWVVTFILSFFLGFLGADRFYLKQYRWAVWKLLTLGGFGLWWFIDTIYYLVKIKGFSQVLYNESKHGKYSLGIAVSTSAIFLLFISAQITLASYKVSGTSMLPGISNGQYVLINKLAYFSNGPKRGDIIIHYWYNQPDSARINRVIALPGDTIEVRGGIVIVNSTPLNEFYILERPTYEYPLQTIPADSYFVLGDNRNNSSDSHLMKLVYRNHILGRYWITYWTPK